MILSDWDIMVYLEKKLLVINPLFEDTVRENGVDLRFGYRFCRFKGGDIVVDTKVMNVPEVLDCVDASKDEGFIIKPYEHVLATTLEWIELPHDLVGLVNLRSSFARAGTYIPPCLSPESWVLGDGGIPLRAAEARSVYDPIARVWSSKKVSIGYAGELVKVYVDDVPEIVTPNHRYMVFDETGTPPYMEKPAMLLEPGDLVAVARQPILTEFKDEVILIPNSNAHVRVDEELVNRILDLAKEHRVSLSELGGKIYRSRGYVRQLINSEYGVRFKDLRLLLEILGIPVLDVVDHIYISTCGERYPARNFTHKVSEVARFVGYYVGNGAPLLRVQYPKITEGDEELATEYAELGRHLFNVNYTIQKRGNKYMVIFGHVLRDWLLEHFNEGVARISRMREVPHVVLSSSNKAIAEFLTGLYDAEGSSDEIEDYAVYTTSQTLAVQVKLTLLRLGVYAFIDAKPCPKYRNKYTYGVRVSGLSARKLLRVLLKQSKKRFSPISSTEKVDLIPLSYIAKKAIRELPYDDEDVGNKLMNYARGGRMPIVNIPIAISKLREYRPQGYVEAIRDIMWTSRFRWIEVKQVEKIPYEGEVIDWETPSGWHVTYGTITHNTVIDSGFKGNITIEIIGGPHPVRVYPEQRFLHVVFLRTSSPVYRPYSGKYQGQVNVTPPKPD